MRHKNEEFNLTDPMAALKKSTRAPRIALAGPQKPAFDPDAAQSLLADLIARSRLYHRSQDYQELLDFTSRLRPFAPFNAFLSHVQKPRLSYAASARDVDPLALYQIMRAAGQVEALLELAMPTTFSRPGGSTPPGTLKPRFG